MKQIAPLLGSVLFGLFLGCQGSSDQDTTSPAKDDPPPDTWRVMVKDSADYDRTFIEELSPHEHHIQLVDSLMIMQPDTFPFPGAPALGESIVLTGQTRDSVSVTLRVKRVNYTSVDYRFELSKPGKESQMKSGRATLRPSFYMTSQHSHPQRSDLFDSSNMVHEYSETRDGCWIRLLLGKSKSGPHVVGQLKRGCEEYTIKMKYNTVLEELSYLSPGESPDLGSWTGNYIYEEEPVTANAGYVAAMKWELSIDRDGKTYQGILRVEGQQTFFKLWTSVAGDSNAIVLIHQRLMDGTARTLSPGDTLFRLLREEGHVQTVWKAAIPRLEQELSQKCRCFQSKEAMKASGHPSQQE